MTFVACPNIFFTKKVIFLPFCQKIDIFSEIWHQKWILWLISIWIIILSIFMHLPFGFEFGSCDFVTFWTRVIHPSHRSGVYHRAKIRRDMRKLMLLLKSATQNYLKSTLKPKSPKTVLTSVNFHLSKAVKYSQG